MNSRFGIFFIIFLWVIGCDIPSSTHSAICQQEKIGNAMLRDYEEAERLFSRYQFTKSYEISQKLYKKHPSCIEIKHLYAKALYGVNKEEAIPVFKELYNEMPKTNPEILYTLGKYAYDQKSYAEAKDYLAEYINDFPNHKLISKAEVFYVKAIQRHEIIETSKGRDVVITKLPPTINSDALEYLPSLNVYEDLIVFTRRLNGQEDLFYALFRDGEWQEALPISGINSMYNEGAHCISSDGSIIVYTFCDAHSYSHSCDLYISYQENGEWMKPEPLNSPVNTEQWESQPSLTADGKYLYFTSNRKGGLGKADIYRAERISDREWGNVMNLGSAINSDGEESSPFISKDYQTLYFSSDSLPGLGNKDVFMTRFSPGKGWSQPLNLGIPYNTEKDDGTISVNAKGIDAYITSDREGGGLDIFKMSLVEELRALQTQVVTGVVVDKQKNNPLPNVHVSVLQHGDTILIADALTGKKGVFTFTLPIGVDYGMWADKESYSFYSGTLYLSDFLESREEPIRMRIELEKPEFQIGESHILHNVFFETGKSILKPSALTELEKLYVLLEKYPRKYVKISGYTDDIGSAQLNIFLSQDRAKAVVEWLHNRGIEANRLSYEGLGEVDPIADNQTEEGRRLNRRVEFRLLDEKP